MDAPTGGHLTPAELDVLLQSPAWGPWPGEEKSSGAREAFDDYYAAGNGRSMQALLKTYHERKAKGGQVPCSAIMTLTRWRKKFNWDERIMARDHAQEVGGADHSGKLTLDAMLRRREEKTDDEYEVGKQNNIDALLKRRDDPKTPASALPAIVKSIQSLWGHPIDKEDNLDSIVGLPPGHPPLTFEENEYLYRCISQSQREALVEIMRLRDERLNPPPPKPLTLLDDEAADG